MKNTINANDIDSLEKEFAEFAKNHIASRKNLYHLKNFPVDLWEKMAEAKLFEISADQKYGGKELDLASISRMGQILSRHGRCMGITLSWLLQILITRMVNKYGSKSNGKIFESIA